MLYTSLPAMSMTAQKAMDLMRKAGGSVPGSKGVAETAVAVAGEDQDWEEGDGEWEYEEGGDDGQWGYDEEVELVDDSGDYMQLRPQMGGRNRMRNVGIHTIEIYYPQFYIKQIEMEEFDATPERYGPSVIGKYTKGIGMIEARYPTDDEDPISFAMTCIHRLMERMEKEGFNETWKYSADGSALKVWNSVGRLDIGSESLVDRSKSMKAYCMDLFERYGEGEGNIEGVDMYNACYGGQAAGLCAQNWVESDRWDGRYGLAIATDISDAPHEALFCVGAACTGALYYPEAPLPHHSHRSSCILHRFDFFKPVGWYHMGPVVDGKYSIDAYMNCVDACYQTLKHKMNGRPLLQITDYNVFHTGGGYHVVKKAFERCIRSEDPKTKQEQREKYVQEKLLPSVHLLKIIGPCHTVSSFLNISSVVMSKWDEAIGKVLLVFTYGSGCASSMYQLRFDELAWFDPLAVWKVKQFYRNAIHVSPSLTMHNIYIETWMKFDYRPHGRQTFGFGYDSYELDAYYLMEIDPWGRRFYHRGGMRSGPMNRKFQNATALNYDKVENRHMREHFGNLPPNGEAWEKQIAVEDKKVHALEAKWKAIEEEMTFEPIEDKENKHEYRGQNIVVQEVGGPTDADDEEEGEETTYQIAGSWSCMQEPEEMTKTPHGSFTFEVVLGANCWEQFYLVRNNNISKKIYPAVSRSYKDMPCVGPHKGTDRPRCWLISGRPSFSLPGEDEGQPGSRYCVTFTPGKVKRLTWDKMEGEVANFQDTASYYITASSSCWEPLEMQSDPSRQGVYTAEVQKTGSPLLFQILRNKDSMQRIYPDTDAQKNGNLFSTVAPVDELGVGRNWEVEGDVGDVFKIMLERNPSDLRDICVSWEKVANRPVQEEPPRYFLVGTPNRWGDGETLEMTSSGSGYTCEVHIDSLPTVFQILENNLEDRRLHPDSKDAGPGSGEVIGPEPARRSLCWSIDSSVATVGDVVTVKLALEPSMSVSWS